MSDNISYKQSEKFIVGLTGGIGSGKTTVAKLFEQLHIDIVDADIVAREVVVPGQPALQKIIQHFGDQIVTECGQLNRTLLRTLIFSDPKKKEWLNKLLHPLIRESLLTQIAATQSPYCLLVAPLLIENNLHHIVDRVLVIDVSEETQVLRVIQRDPSNAQEIKRIIANQIPRKQRVSAADDVISNESTQLHFIKEHVAKLHQAYTKLAQNKKKHHQ
ncbi:MAG: dephospho-CoA kinase [Alteromonadaceae bacterium]|jgi:dephospho-CoA kinase